MCSLSTWLIWFFVFILSEVVKMDSWSSASSGYVGYEGEPSWVRDERRESGMLLTGHWYIEVLLSMLLMWIVDQMSWVGSRKGSKSARSEKGKHGITKAELKKNPFLWFAT